MHLQVNINGSQVVGMANMTILQLCMLVGIYIPRFCYHEKLSIVGSCRMCLVEICKSAKPMVACATPLSSGMEIYTETALVKNAREHVLEFLLINHPLDCPICDQGGECDLQDQSLLYGSDLGRFKESKRSVLEKNFGPFIKTMMTRCIHCTRCVRFMSEIASTNLLGVLGRGKDMEIGTYIDIGLNSEISGNIIDICPVGALTSKPFAYTNRSWELRSSESVDILDGLGSSIRMDFRGAEIVRILPKTNEFLNEQWITNKIRFTYDGFKYRRLAIPLVNKKCWSLKRNKYIYVNTSWEFICKLVVYALIYLLVCSKMFYFALGDLVDLKTMCMVDQLASWFGCLITSNFGSYFDVDIRDNFVLNKSVPHFEKSNAYVFVGCDFILEAPLLSVRMSKRVSRNFAAKKIIGSFGPLSKYSNDIYQLGVHASSLVTLVEGRHFFCNKLSSFAEIVWISNQYYRFTQSGLFDTLNFLAQLTHKKNSINLLHTDCSNVAKADIGCVNDRPEYYRKLHLYDDQLMVYNIGLDKTIENKGNISCVVYQNHHNLCTDVFKNVFIFLPSTTFVEKTQIYVNTEGRFLFSRKAVAPPGLAKDDSEILMAICTMLGFYNFTFKMNKKRELKYDILSIIIPQWLTRLKRKKSIIGSMLWQNYYTNDLYACRMLLFLMNMGSLLYIGIIDNFYNTNIISAASKILSKVPHRLFNYRIVY